MVMFSKQDYSSNIEVTETIASVTVGTQNAARCLTYSGFMIGCEPGEPLVQSITGGGAGWLHVPATEHVTDFNFVPVSRIADPPHFDCGFGSSFSLQCGSGSCFSL
jgi:hypothetical protein